VNARVEQLRTQAKQELPPRLAELAALHGFHYNKVFIKNNVSNWGSCSSLGNINLNLRLVELPSQLRDYVMLHELCHLKYLNHSPEFHALLESVCPGHRALARQMKEYKIR
jgi:predicted metal-dependent hydrolase